MSDVVKQRAADNEQRLEAVRQRGAELYQGSMAAQEERNGLFGERARLDGERLALDQAIWPFTGLFPEPEAARLHVIPAGMWRYSLPLTPALESMVPPTPEADPNVLVLARIAGGLDFMTDSQAADDPAGQRRAEVTFRSEERRRAEGGAAHEQEQRQRAEQQPHPQQRNANKS